MAVRRIGPRFHPELFGIAKSEERIAQSEKRRDRGREAAKVADRKARSMGHAAAGSQDQGSKRSTRRDRILVRNPR